MTEPVEYPFLCPYCGQPITMLLDPGPGTQEYIEDCEICCNPIALHLRIDAGVVDAFEARPVEQ